MLSVDPLSYDYKFNKTLNEDVKLKSNEYGRYDLDMTEDDYINVTGHKSLLNACIIAILTRYNELKQIPLYEGFGCRVHDQVKYNKTRLQTYKIETAIQETLDKMRRVKTVDYLEVVDTGPYSYGVNFQITSINDFTVKGKVNL